MSKHPKHPKKAPGAAASVRTRIIAGGERLWRLDDFADLPFAAVAQALSRLVRAGEIERLSKGTYYRSRPTAFGRSRPNSSDVHSLASKHRAVFPSGIAAASHLGFTSQSPRHGEVATNAPSLPRKLVGQDTVVHTRRPEAWTSLLEPDAALLDFLRRAGRTSELSPSETIRRTQSLLSERGRFRRLLSVAGSEPPRVRAMLGAFGEAMKRPAKELNELRQSLNPFSRFDFGMFGGLPTAKSWQAKGAG